jgi:putative membrane protein
MLWIKALHIIFMVAWFAGLFYLPRLFVYHAMSTDAISLARFKIMERKLYYGITTPSGILTVAFGLWLLFIDGAYLRAHWMQVKLVLVAVLAAYHFYLGRLRSDFERDANKHDHRYYRWVNEFPILILVPVVILVVVKPF